MRPDDWRPLMPTVRAVAKQLAEKSQIEVTQKGKVVDIDAVKGPIRLRLCSQPTNEDSD